LIAKRLGYRGVRFDLAEQSDQGLDVGLYFESAEDESWCRLRSRSMGQPANPVLELIADRAACFAARSFPLEALDRQ
jgi:hypothetical protein